jgi:hypothetical protein
VLFFSVTPYTLGEVGYLKERKKLVVACEAKAVAKSKETSSTQIPINQCAVGTE